ncbi:hypothetical protein ES702_04972 [subsurface metagenome]
MKLVINHRTTEKGKFKKYYVYDLDSTMCLFKKRNYLYWDYGIKKAHLFDTRELAENEMQKQNAELNERIKFLKNLNVLLDI